MAAEQIVVCDTGSGTIKAGFAGNVYPRVQFETAVGRPPRQSKSSYAAATSSNQNADPNAAAGGADAATPPALGAACYGAARSSGAAAAAPAHSVAAAPHLSVTRPVHNGIVNNWPDATLLWHEVFERQLQIDPSATKLLLADSPLNSPANRIKALEVLFEQLGFDAVLLQPSPVLALYSQGLTTGLVVDCGATQTSVVPVLDNWTDVAHMKRVPVAGDHVTRRLQLLVQHKLTKETTCLNTPYTLPDGQRITLGPERFAAPEVLFQPSLVGIEADGVAHAVHDCVHSLPIDTRLGMYSSILLCGGALLLPGASTRLERDLSSLYLHKTLKGRDAGMSKLRLKVVDPPLRAHATFSGAAVLADVISGYTDSWVTKRLWHEDRNAAIKRAVAELPIS